MNCYYKAANGNISNLYKDLYKKYNNESIALQHYAYALTKSFQQNLQSKDYDENNEPWVYLIPELDFNSTPNFSKNNKITATENIIAANSNKIKVVENGYTDEKGKPLERVTKAIERFTKPYNEKDYVNMVLAKIPESEREGKIEELKEKFKANEKAAENGTALHEMLQKIFDEKLYTKGEISSNINFITENYDLDLLFSDDIENKEGFLVNRLFSIINELAGKYDFNKVKILSEVPVYDFDSSIAGTIDLVVINPDGTVDIYDYKFSGSTLFDWNKYKEEAVNYQQMFYTNILRKLGVNVKSTNVISVQMSTDKNNLINRLGSPTTTNLSLRFGPESDVVKNVESVIPTNYVEPLKSTESVRPIIKTLKDLFDYEINEVGEVNIPESVIQAEIKRKKLSRFRNFNGDLIDPTKLSEEELYNEVKKFLQEKERRRSKLPEAFKEYVENKRKNPATKWKFLKKGAQTDVDRRFNILNSYISSTFKDKNGNNRYTYDVIMNDELSSLGMVMMINNLTGEGTLFSISEDDLNAKKEFTYSNRKVGKAKTVLGNFFNGYEEQKFNLPKNSNGNLELLKAAMYLLYQNNELKNIPVRQLVSLSTSSMPKVSDTEMMIDYIKEIDKSGVIKDELLLKRIRESYNDKKHKRNSLGVLKTYLEDFKRNKTSLIWEGKEWEEYFEATNNANDISEVLENLIERQKQLMIYAERGDAKGAAAEEELEIINALIVEHYNLYPIDDIDIDRLGLFGFTENRIFTDADKFSQNSLAALAQVNKAATGAIRRRFIEYKKQSNKITDELIREKLGTRRNFLGDTINAYKNIFEKRQVDGEWKYTFRLRDPDNDILIAPDQSPLSDTEKEYIRHYMQTLDKARKERLSDSQYMSFKDNPDRQREIPLIKASTISRMVSKQNAKDALSSYLENMLNIDLAFEDDLKYQENKKTRVEITDSMIWLETNEEARKQKLEEFDHSEFEKNLELVLDLYSLNHARVMEYRKKLPIIHAIKGMVNMAQNKWFRDLPETQKAIDKIIEEVVFRIQDEKPDEAKMKKFANLITEITSALRLGFSITLAPTIFLTNLWNGLSTNTLGIAKDRLGLKNYMKGMWTVIGHPENIVDDYNFIQELSVEYGISGGELSRLRQTLSRDERGLMAFKSKWMHWLNSVPDYVHKLGMFTGEMIKEGTLKVNEFGRPTKDSAHQYINGKLVYNEKLDDRFSLLFDPNADKESLEYKKQESFYNAIKQELIGEEGGLNEDGSLARAYSERMRNDKTDFANLLYGDYNPEAKSEFERMAIGRIFMQFRRWMKAKAQQWTGKRTTVGGQFKAYLVDSNGIPLEQEVESMTNEEYQNYLNQGYELKHMWEGRLHEGIFQTLMFIGHEIKDKGLTNIKLEDYRKKNLGQLFMDMILLGFLSLVAIPFIKENFGEFVSQIFDNSSMDFNPLNYVGANPFSPYSISPAVGLDTINDVFKDTVLNISDPEDLLNAHIQNFAITQFAYELQEI